MENQARNAIITLVLSLALLFTVKTVLAEDSSGKTYANSPVIMAGTYLPSVNFHDREQKAY